MTTLIESLDALLGGMNERVNALAEESRIIVEQWDQLGRMGAQREDHAAALLGKLIPHLRNIRQFAISADDRLCTFIAAPFAE